MAFDSNLFHNKRTEFNREMKNLQRRGQRRLKSEIDAKVGGGSDLARGISGSTKMRHGEIYRIGWKTERYGFILNQGTKGNVSSHTRSRYGTGTPWRVAAHKRRPIAAKKWIQNAMDVVVPDAANTIARLKADDEIEVMDQMTSGFVGKSKFRVG